MPVDGEWDLTTELADRLYNEYIQDYPRKLDNRCGPAVEDGHENFAPVGDHFAEWAEHVYWDENSESVSEGQSEDEGEDEDTSDGRSTFLALREGINTRYDNCLIIDDIVLRNLAALPDELPLLGPWDNSSLVPGDDFRRMNRLSQDAWLWVLDREA
jgi:hypothetical protein